MWWWMAWVAWAQEAPLVCPPAPTQAVMQTAAEVERAYLHLDKSAYDVARFRLERFIECIDEPLALDAVIQLHRARALMAYVDEELEASKRSVVFWPMCRDRSTSPSDSMIPMLATAAAHEAGWPA